MSLFINAAFSGVLLLPPFIFPCLLVVWSASWSRGTRTTGTSTTCPTTPCALRTRPALYQVYGLVACLYIVYIVLLFIWRRPFLAIWHFMSRDFPRLKDFSWLQEFPFLRLLSSQDFLSPRLPGHKVMFINNRIKYNFVRILDKNKTKTLRCVGRTFSIECLDNILFQEFCSWYYLNCMMVDLSIH